MSHIVEIKDIPFKDFNCLRAAVARIPGATLHVGEMTIRVFSQHVNCVAHVRLPGWMHPVAIKADGTAAYDNYGGVWGKQETLNALKQGYSTEAAKALAKKQGYIVVEKKKGNAIVLELTR